MTTTCPFCRTEMIRGGVTVKNSAWRLGSAAFTGDIMYLTDAAGAPSKEIMRNGWIRDAFHCEACDATLIFDGRKTSPSAEARNSQV